MNDTTKRFHRNMNQAFGPYCSRHITEPTRPFDWEDKIVLWACVLTVSALGIVWCLT